MKYNLIIKPKKFDRFTVVPNYILRHKGISIGATGLYSYLFSHSADQQITIEFISQHFKEGKDAIRSKINELIENGYLERERVLDKGKFKGYNYKLKSHPKRKNRNREKPKSENPTQSNTNNTNNNNIRNTNISFNDNLLKIYPHFLQLFPTKYQPKTESQTNKWIECLNKLNTIDGYDFKKLWLMVKFIRDHEFWSEHFLTLLKLRNKDKNGIRYVDKYFETYKNANRPKFFWKIKGIIKYFIYVEDGKEKLGAKTKNGDLNYFNLNQVFNKYELKELIKHVKNE